MRLLILGLFFLTACKHGGGHHGSHSDQDPAGHDDHAVSEKHAHSTEKTGARVMRLRFERMDQIKTEGHEGLTQLNLRVVHSKGDKTVTILDKPISHESEVHDVELPSEGMKSGYLVAIVNGFRSGTPFSKSANYKIDEQEAIDRAKARLDKE